MKTYSTEFKVEAEHLDKGDHANWLVQLSIAQNIHHLFRDQVGLGLEEMMSGHKLFLVMGTVKNVHYRKQLRKDNLIDVQITLWIASRTTLEFHCLFHKEGEVCTEMSWVMPLISVETERLCKIPEWIVGIIGKEKPQIPISIKPTSTT